MAHLNAHMPQDWSSRLSSLVSSFVHHSVGRGAAAWATAVASTHEHCSRVLDYEPLPHDLSSAERADGRIVRGTTWVPRTGVRRGARLGGTHRPSAHPTLLWPETVLHDRGRRGASLGGRSAPGGSTRQMGVSAVKRGDEAGPGGRYLSPAAEYRSLSGMVSR